METEVDERGRKIHFKMNDADEMAKNFASNFSFLILV